MSSQSVPFVICLLCVQSLTHAISLSYNHSIDAIATSSSRSSSPQASHSNLAGNMAQTPATELLASGSNPYHWKSSYTGEDDKIVQQKLNNFVDSDAQQHVDDGFGEDAHPGLSQSHPPPLPSIHNYGDPQYLTQQKEMTGGNRLPARLNSMHQHPRQFAYPPLAKHFVRRPVLSLTGEGKFQANRPLSNYYPFYAKSSAPSTSRMASRRRIPAPRSFYNPLLPLMMHPFSLYPPFWSPRMRAPGRPFAPVMFPGMYRHFSPGRATYLQNMASHQHAHPGVSAGHNDEQQRKEVWRAAVPRGIKSSKNSYFDDAVGHQQYSATDSKKGGEFGVKRKQQQQFNPRKFSSQSSKNSTASYGTSFYPLTPEQVQQLRVKLEQLKQEKDRSSGSSSKNETTTATASGAVSGARGANRKTSWSDRLK